VSTRTHARTHTLAIVDSKHGKEVDNRTFPANAAGHARAAAWLARRTSDQAVLVSMEGTSSFGLTLKDYLVRGGYRVVHARKPSRAARHVKGKSDQLDTLQAARSTLPLPLDRLLEPKGGEIATALRALATARNSMSKQRTAAINALTALMRTSALGVDARKPLTSSLVKTIAAWRTRREGLVASVQRAEAIRLAKQVTALAEELASNAAQSTQLTASIAPTLLDLPGVGGVAAAVILGSWSHPGRIRNEAAFAALAGTCPLPASSGNTIRYRPNRSGDRRLNSAIHRIAIVRMRCDDRTKEYVKRRTKEGRTKKEIIRCLKRYITRELYRTLNRIGA